MTENEKLIVATAINILDSYLRKDQVMFNDPDAVRNYLRLQLATLEEENFVCLFLDSQHRLLANETVSKGTLDSAAVYPRVIVKKSLSYNAAAVILSHNHPSGVAEPSRADRAITERLSQALALVDIRVLDHFVVGNPDIVSFAERGWL
jgi:DNA repair protein RadC